MPTKTLLNLVTFHVHLDPISSRFHFIGLPLTLKERTSIKFIDKNSGVDLPKGAEACVLL
jgi:hypothetical protein